jgi:surfeit locus 1 family protein
VTFTGVPDYAHEFALTGRTRNGSPGVNIITPFRIPGRDTVVLVNRGWVYSPDASRVDFARWKEPDTLMVAGYVETTIDTIGEVGEPTRQFRQMDHRRISAQLPYAVERFYVVALAEGTTSGPDTPVRLPLTTLAEGPHKSYAIQWFSFAAIALLGTAAYLASSRLRAA